MKWKRLARHQRVFLNGKNGQLGVVQHASVKKEGSIRYFHLEFVQQVYAAKRREFCGS